MVYTEGSTIAKEFNNFIDLIQTSYGIYRRFCCTNSNRKISQLQKLTIEETSNFIDHLNLAILQIIGSAFMLPMFTEHKCHTMQLSKKAPDLAWDDFSYVISKV